MATTGTNGATAPLAKCFKSLTVGLTANCVLTASSSVTSNVYVPAVWTNAGVYEYKECPGTASATSAADYAAGVTEAHLATLLGSAIWSGATTPTITTVTAGSGVLQISNSGASDEFGEWSLKFRVTVHTGSAAGIFAVTAPTCTTGDECSATTTCAAGRHAVDISAPATGYVCALCSAGTYKTASGSAACSLCAAGTAEPQVGSTTSCSSNDCGAGRGAPEGSSDCVPCSPGSFAKAADTECQVCEGYWSSHVYGASACVKCFAGRPVTCDGSVGNLCTDNTPGTSADFVATMPSTALPLPSGFSSYAYPGLLGTCAATAETTLAFAVSGTCSVEIRALGVSTLFPVATGLQCSHPNNAQAALTAYYSGASTIVSLPSLTAASTMITIGGGSETTTTFTLSAATTSPTATLPDDVAVTLTVTGGQLAGGAAEVATCPARTFLESGTTVYDVSCAPCPTGSFCTAGSATDTMCESGQGQPLLGGTCVDCAAGTYAIYPGTSSCVSCDGTVVDDNGAAVSLGGTGCYSTCSAQLHQVYDEETATCGCEPGYGVDNGLCVQCLADHYSPGGAEACAPCAAGATAPVGSAACSLCLPGEYYNSATSECVECGPGLQPNAGATACDACDAGFYKDANMATCARCMGGYKVVLDGQLRVGCAACIPGSFSMWSSAAVRVPLTETACELCALGTYAKTGGQKRCLSCPGGTYTSSEGAAACTKCAPGKFRPPFGGACSDCPAGHSTNGKAGAISCRPCSSGEYAAASGVAMCVPCAANHFSGPKALVCSKCPAGTDTAGEKGAGQCMECDPGKYGASVGSSCAECAPGSFSSVYGASECRSCGLGQFAEDAGAEACEMCPAGSYGPKTGLRACRVCPAGSYSTPGRGSCTLCPAGRVAPSPGSIRCAACLPGTTAAGAGQKECDPCPAGSRCPAAAAAPVACPAGSFQDKTGQRACKKCPKRSYAPDEGSTECLPCPGNVGGGLATCTVAAASG